MNSQRVDIIIPTYNGLPYLKQAVDSVLKQSHKDLVLYVVDDGSTDRGATQKYVEGLKDPRVKYVRKKNGGQASARNYGIRISDSPYLTFLDADDTWRPDKLRRQLTLFEKNPGLGMVYGLHKLIDADNNIFGEVVWRKRGDLFRYLLHGNKISGSGSMVMVKREVFDKVGVFREDFLIGEDWEMWLRIAYNYPIDFVDDYIADLRVLDTGMQQNYLKMAEGLEYMFPIMLKEFKPGLLDRAILAKTCLKEAFFLYFNGGSRSSARRVFWKAFRYNPLTFFSRRPRVWFLYMRVLLGNESLRLLRRKFSAGYRQREQEFAAAKEHSKKAPLVSVILPVFNGEKYLREAIDSILGQTFKNFELIVINDGSIDGTQKIIDSYEDKRIIKVRQKNMGIVASLNRGIDIASGKFIARQDADDISLPLRLQKEVEAMHKHHDLILIGTQAIVIDEVGKKVKEYNYPTSDAVLRLSMFKYNPFVHGSVMFKAVAARAIGGYEETASPAEDYELWRQMAYHGQIMNTMEPLYMFRYNLEGVSLKDQPKQTSKIIELRKRYFRRSYLVLRSPLTVNRALRKDPGLKATALLLLKVSVLRLRPINVIFLTLSLLFALPQIIRSTDD